MPSPDDLVRNAMWDKFAELIRVHDEYVALREHHTDEAAAAEETRKLYYDEIQQFQSVGLRMGFDFFLILNEQGPRPSNVFSNGKENNSDFSVKDFVLAQVRQAYPQPILASEIRQMIENLGHDVHEKTVGMTLYRLSKKHRVRREGKEWYFVPEEDRQRLTQKDKAEDQLAEDA